VGFVSWLVRTLSVELARVRRITTLPVLWPVPPFEYLIPTSTRKPQFVSTSPSRGQPITSQTPKCPNHRTVRYLACQSTPTARRVQIPQPIPAHPTKTGNKKKFKKEEKRKPTFHNPPNRSTICRCTNSSVPGALAATVGKHAAKLSLLILSSVCLAVEAKRACRRTARGPGGGGGGGVLSFCCWSFGSV
jgi:hypothetical protein